MNPAAPPGVTPPTRAQRIETALARLARAALTALEIVIVVVLAAFVVLAIFGLVMELPSLVHGEFRGTGELGAVLDHILAVFILIELLATAVAYVTHRNVLSRILEAGVVALLRKLIALAFTGDVLAKSGALAIVLVAIALAWLLLHRARAI